VAEITQQLFSVGEAASMLGCSVSSIWRDLKAQRLTATRIGGRTRITRASLEALLAHGAPLEAPKRKPPPRRSRSTPK
jgi:excisionase family DNA binding protein